MANGCRLFLQVFDKTGPGQSRRPLVDLAHELGWRAKNSVSSLFSLHNAKL